MGGGVTEGPEVQAGADQEAVEEAAGTVVQAPVIRGMMTWPSQASVSASNRLGSVAGSTSARVATPSRSIRGTAAETTLAQPQAGADGPPSARASTSMRGPGSPAAQKAACRPRRGLAHTS